MLFDLVDTLQKKRRLLYVALFIIIDFWLLTYCTQTLQAHRADITARIHSSERVSNPVGYQSDTLDLHDLAESIGHAANTVEVSTLRTTVTVTDGIAKAEHNLQIAAKTTARVTGATTIATVHATGWALSLSGHLLAFPYVATAQGIEYGTTIISKTTSEHLAPIIKPKKDAAVPVITPEQAQQVLLIQSGTLDIKPVKPTGAGGACDSGAGNGGYPMDWCNTAMDTVRTVSYSGDRINRECTSYAYWYFTAIEGHTDFHFTGNANRWAATSNFPTHKTPAAGAIAVETTGAYGHVAIVQALPGQTYEGKVVPDGYVLVSEMNYDWHGHFRYSYSPLGKFSAYIYP
jgi:surface antigen